MDNHLSDVCLGNPTWSEINAGQCYLCFSACQSQRTKRFMLICQWDLPSMVKMVRKSALSSKRHSLGYVRVLERSGNTSQSNSKNAGWSNQNLIAVYSLDPMSFMWFTSTTLFFGQKNYH